MRNHRTLLTSLYSRNPHGHSTTGASLCDSYRKRYGILLKTEEQIRGIALAGKIVQATFAMLTPQLAPGMTTDDINTLVHDFTLAHDAVPAPLGYKGFPKSVCVSINDVICHGIPGNRVLMKGDIVNIDITTIKDGFYADSNQTFFIGEPSPEARKIVEIARTCLDLAIKQARPGRTLGDIGWAIQEHAESRGCSVVREMVGHGVGLAFHEPPDVFHIGRPGTGIPLVPGMVFTIEPMVNLGDRSVRVLEDGWTIVTRDGSLSAQFEKTLAITPTGCTILTPF
ncbi:MAG: type I methionyl aminopeptidase [Desulfoplanes sp.]